MAPMQVTTRQSFVEANGPKPDLAVYFDIFRASTTLAALVSRGATPIYGTNDPVIAERLVAGGARLVSEVFRGGFDNSPTQILTAELAGRQIVHKSTNLTTAVMAELGRAGRTLVGAFVNMSRLVAEIQKSGAQRIELVAAAHKSRAREAPEDTACMEMVARWLRGEQHREIREQGQLEAMLADKRQRRPDIREHYFADAALALRVDALPHVLEVSWFAEGICEYREVGE